MKSLSLLSRLARAEGEGCLRARGLGIKNTRARAGEDKEESPRDLRMRSEKKGRVQHAALTFFSRARAALQALQCPDIFLAAALLMRAFRRRSSRSFVCAVPRTGDSTRFHSIEMGEIRYL